MLKNTCLVFLVLLLYACVSPHSRGQIMTVNGPIASDSAGKFLTHEHILVDFIGADSIHSGRWNKDEVVQKMLPYLLEAKKLGCQTFVDCTPDYLGRDVVLLQELSKLSGVNILTNTGLYGASDNKYLPQFAYDESATQLAKRWINEWENGIYGTDVRPGFIKIGVNGNRLSEMHSKLVSAAAKTHLETGLVIVSHTGPAYLAHEQLAVLKNECCSRSVYMGARAS